MIEIGVYNKLKVLRETSVGWYLGAEDGEDVLLPKKYCPQPFIPGEEMEVFVYLDKEERKVATTVRPKILLNQFASLKVSSVTRIGAFLDWGPEKDLLVPFREQKQTMEEGNSYVVFLGLDKVTGRLYASAKVEKFLDNERLSVQNKEKVSLLVYKKTELGFSVIINNRHRGLIFNEDVFKDIRVGSSLEGYVKRIRPDGNIDISLQAIGYNNYNMENSEIIYLKLVENNGFLPVTDKSSPEEIYALFGISKKAFKKSVGSLYKQQRIKIEEQGLRLA